MISLEQIQDIIDSNETYSKQYFIWQMDPDNTSLEQFFIDQLQPDLDERVLALMQHTGDYYIDCEYDISHNNWYVLTDSEADERCDSYAEDSLSDELHSIPTHLHRYFNAESYLEDYIAGDRGSILSGYDGNEHEESVNNTTYYLYRQ